MQTYLRSLGINVQQVTRKRRTGHYLAEFFVPEMREPVPPAALWAQTISDAGLTVLDSEDTVASWRPDRPVIWATVTFALG